MENLHLSEFIKAYLAESFIKNQTMPNFIKMRNAGVGLKVMKGGIFVKANEYKIPLPGRLIILYKKENSHIDIDAIGVY